MRHLFFFFFNFAFSQFQAVLQITEDVINSQLGLLNKNIFRIFPNATSLFVQTTPKQYLFDGISFCTDGDEITIFLCKVVNDVVNHRNIKAIRKNSDGSLKFAFFYYVNNFANVIFPNEIIFNFRRRITHTTESTKFFQD